MIEKPIIMQPHSVVGILAGRKWQTRRIVRGGPVCFGAHGIILKVDGLTPVKLRYAVGDELWVRENYRLETLLEDIPAGIMTNSKDAVMYCADGFIRGESIDDFGRVRSSRFMPRWASRLTLVVTAVRVERVQEISEADAVAEGIQQELVNPPHGFDPDNFHPPGAFGYVSGLRPFPKGTIYPTAKEAYLDLFDSINGAGAAARNPLVEVYGFAVKERR